MTLEADYKNLIFYWADDAGIPVSPHFDYEEDAVQWKKFYWDSESDSR